METHLYPRKTVKNTDYTVWMGFPERYEFSMSSLGYLWLFKIIDEMEDVYAQRICLDTEHTGKEMPDLFSFSMSFDFDFLKIFEMLEKYNIPLKSLERNKPLVFAGGPVVTANPEPYKDIFDFFIIGDGEDVNKKVVEFCKNNREMPKNELLSELSKFEGVYVPYISKKVVKSTKRLENCIYTPILSDEAFFKNTFIIEVERGCTNRCGFCLASYLNLPLRSVPDDKLFETIDLGLKHTNKLAFLGAEVSAHPKFKEICKYIYDKNSSDENIEINFSSLRVDAINEDVVKTLVLAGQKNITLAIEAGSERLRKVINKNISEEQILNVVKIASKNGLKGIKFYGMLGLPTETQEDIDALVTLAKRIKTENKGLDITFGFSSFVPKPHTPFQWCGRENTKSLEKKCAYIQKEFHKLGINVQLPSIKWDYWQAVLSRGCKAAKQPGSYAVQNSGKLKVESGKFNNFQFSTFNFQLSNNYLNFTDFLIDVYRQGGKLGAFKASAKKHNIDADYYAYGNFNRIPPYLTHDCNAHSSLTITPSPTKEYCRRGEVYFDAELPWDFIEIKPGKEFLAKEYCRLLEGKSE